MRKGANGGGGVGKNIGHEFQGRGQIFSVKCYRDPPIPPSNVGLILYLLNHLSVSNGGGIKVGIVKNAFLLSSCLQLSMSPPSRF